MAPLMSNDVRGDEGGGDVEEQVWGKEWMLRGPARSGEDEEKTLPGRVAAGDFLSHTHTHTQEGVKKLSLGVCVLVMA